MKLKNFLGDTFSIGKGAVKLPIHEMIEKHRTNYESLNIKNVSIYKMLGSNNAIAHIEIPSETVENFHYDVVLEFIPDGDSFEECHIKVFSNSPSFIFTYAFIFYHLDDPELKTKGMIMDKYHQKIPKNNLLVKEGANQTPEEILKGAPVTRNPLGLPLFDKTIYYAIFALMDRYDYKKFIRNLRMIAPRALEQKIEDFDTLMKRRKRLEQQQRALRGLTKAKGQKENQKTYRMLEREFKRHQTDSAVNHVTQAVSSGVNKVKSSTSGGVNRVRSSVRRVR